MRVQIASSAAEIDRLRPIWEFLYRQSPDQTLFQSFAWNRLAALHFASREAAYVVCVESESGIALIPAAVTSNQLTLLGESLFDYRDVLRTGNEEPLRAAWAHLGELHLPLAVTALRGETARHAWDLLDPAPFVNAPQVLVTETTAQLFSAAHSRLERTLRRLAQQGVELLQYNGSDSDVIAWVYRQKAAQFSGSPHNLFSDPVRIDFMVAACGLDPAACEIFVFQAAGQPVAALLTFREQTVRRFYTIWFDPAWAKLSPGSALVFEVTRRSLAAGLDCDYMTGEQPHKMRFATSLVPLYSVKTEADVLVGADVESAA
jgi:CelD/BcsL family acetyltransferase involved in cellulose biosynthesis